MTGGRGDEGSVTAWMIIAVIGVFLLVGLLLDGGRILRARSEAFGLAAAAGRAAAQQLDEDALAGGTVRVDEAAARAAGVAYLDRRGTPGVVTVADNTVTVSVRRTVALLALSSLGGPVTVTATATVDASPGGG